MTNFIKNDNYNTVCTNKNWEIIYNWNKRSHAFIFLKYTEAIPEVSMTYFMFSE
jgi:hypothetical protein